MVTRLDRRIENKFDGVRSPLDSSPGRTAGMCAL
jgi:hypothetical protein